MKTRDAYGEWARDVELLDEICINVSALVNAGGGAIFNKKLDLAGVYEQEYAVSKGYTEKPKEMK